MKTNNKKLVVGIDINEILRAKWVQFDKYYVDEFGEDGAPKDMNPYVYDYFKYYQFNSVTETEIELREPEDTPDNINPIYYQLDEDGKSKADVFLFKAPKEITLTAKEVYYRFMYEDYCYEIHGAAPVMYRNMEVDVNKFYMKYKDTVTFKLLSVENYLSIPSTLFFLSKITSRFKNISFVDKPLDMWKESDILMTTDPEILKSKIPRNKKLIKMNRPYNEDFNNATMDTLHIKELIDNPEFEKLIKFKNKK
jgi:hypothetical protein